MKKGEQINLKTTPADLETLEKARQKLSAQTGKQETVSKTIRKGLEHLANNLPGDRPDLFYLDRVNINKLQTNIETGLLRLSKVLTEFEKVAGEPITLDELQPVYGTGRLNSGIVNSDALREIVVDKLFDQQQKQYPTLQFSRENIRVPDLTELMNAATVLTDIPAIIFHPMFNNRDTFLWHCFSVDESGKVILNQEAIENVKDIFRAAAITPTEKKRLGLVRELCTVLNKFLDDKSTPPEKLNIAGVCFYESAANRYFPAEQFVKYGLSKPLIFTH
jgi:hypothetical protein